MLFDIEARKYNLMEGQLYVEFEPVNSEIKHLVYNGGTYDLINNSVQQTIDFYKNSVREEIFKNLPDDVRAGYTNSQFKITNSIADPSNINYNIFGFHKFEHIEMNDINRKGELNKVDYFKNLSGDPNDINNYSDLVLTENRVYVRDLNTALVSYRDQTTIWYLSDDTTGMTKNTRKYYQLKDSIEEGIERRSNITSFAKLYLLGQIGLTNGQILISELTPYITTYIQGNHQPLIDAVNSSTDNFMTPTIKATVSSILTF